MVSMKKGPGRPIDEESRSRRREEILSCAARLFARHGYQTTGLQSVADEAGIAKGTLYLYFDTKEDLFFAAVDQGMTQMRAAVDRAIENEDDAIELIGKAIYAYLRFFKENPEQAELLILERAEFRDRKQSTYFRHREEGSCRWHAILQNLIDSGRVRKIPITRVDDVVSDLVYGTMFTNHFSGRHKPLESQAQDILDIVFHGILSDRERNHREGKKKS